LDQKNGGIDGADRIDTSPYFLYHSASTNSIKEFERMRIVVAIPFTPWPVRKGTDRLIVNLLEGLSSSHEVALVTMALGREELSRLREIEGPRIRVEAMLAPHRRGAGRRIWHKARNLAFALFRGIPAQVSYAAPSAYLELVAGTARSFGADIVLANYWHLYRLPEYIDPRKLALITHDLDFLVNPNRLSLTPRGIPRAVAALRARSLERIERMAYERYGTILTVTEADAERLGRDPDWEGKRIRPLPLALDLAEFDPTAFSRERNRILFMGTFHSDFNVEAYRYLVREVLPLLRGSCPGFRCDIVGDGVSREMRRIAPPEITFAGYAESIVPYLGRCSLMVLPMRFCGGVRIRMLEAAAMGTAVVSTPDGVAGMGLTAGKEYLEAGSAEEFANAVSRLLEDGAESRRIGSNARRWAEEHLSIETYGDRLEAALRGLGG
jgi:glycosyltransferase involved in cell wall biosynthesis